MMRVDTAASGNGGVARAAANGGAISTGDINSGGNVGNAISVGDTTCAPVADAKYKGAKRLRRAAVGAEVVALPDTGVGIGDPSALFVLITSAGARPLPSGCAAAKSISRKLDEGGPNAVSVRGTNATKPPRLETRRLRFQTAFSERRVPRNPRSVLRSRWWSGAVAPGPWREAPPPRAGRDRAGEYRRPLKPLHLREPALAGANEVAWPPQLEILFREQEAVVAGDHRLQALLTIRTSFFREEQAVRQCSPSSRRGLGTDGVEPARNGPLPR